jgi:hypothetical protein
MNTREIEILLDKYLEGETSLDEERILKTYFSTDDVPEQFKAYAGLFTYFEKEKQAKMPSELEARISENIHRQTQMAFFRNRRFWYYFTGIAASILLVFAFFYQSKLSKNLNTGNVSATRYTIQEKQLAYDQTIEVLDFVSAKLNRGITPLQRMNRINTDGIMPMVQLDKLNQNLEMLNNNMNKVEQGMDNISKISKFSIIIKP